MKQVTTNKTNILLRAVKTASFWVSGPIIPSFHEIKQGHLYSMNYNKYLLAKKEIEGYFAEVGFEDNKLENI